MKSEEHSSKLHCRNQLWTNQNGFFNGGATRPLSRDGGVEEFYGDPNSHAWLLGFFNRLGCYDA